MSKRVFTGPNAVKEASAYLGELRNEQPPSEPTLMERIGQHCIDERAAGRPVPKRALLGPTTFREVVDTYDAKICGDEAGVWVVVAMATGILHVAPNASVPDGEVRYEP